MGVNWREQWLLPERPRCRPEATTTMVQATPSGERLVMGEPSGAKYGGAGHGRELLLATLIMVGAMFGKRTNSYHRATFSITGRQKVSGSDMSGGKLRVEG